MKKILDNNEGRILESAFPNNIKVVHINGVEEEVAMGTKVKDMEA